MPPWYLLVSLLGGVLSVVLIVSAVGCLKYRRAARTGMLAYGFISLTLQAFAVGVNAWSMIGRYRGVNVPLPEAMMMAASTASWALHSIVFPFLLVAFFRSTAVERLFTK
jgi:hypothetical protein